MPNSWINAIREYNQDKKYTVPKKGSPEYDAVKVIQQKNKEMVSSVPIKEPVVIKPVVIKPVVKKTVKQPVVKGDGIKEIV